MGVGEHPNGYPKKRTTKGGLLSRRYSTISLLNRFPENEVWPTAAVSLSVPIILCSSWVSTVWRRGEISLANLHLDPRVAGLELRRVRRHNVKEQRKANAEAGVYVGGSDG